MGKRKIPLEKIKKKSSLQVTFSKRRQGAFKKAAQLSLLTHAHIAIIAFSPGGNPYSFVASPAPAPASLESLLHHYCNGTLPPPPFPSPTPGFWWDNVEQGTHNLHQLQLISNALQRITNNLQTKLLSKGEGSSSKSNVVTAPPLPNTISTTFLAPSSSSSSNYHHAPLVQFQEEEDWVDIDYLLRENPIEENAKVHHGMNEQSPQGCSVFQSDTTCSHDHPPVTVTAVTQEEEAFCNKLQTTVASTSGNHDPAPADEAKCNDVDELEQWLNEYRSREEEEETASMFLMDRQAGGEDKDQSGHIPDNHIEVDFSSLQDLYALDVNLSSLEWD